MAIIETELPIAGCVTVDIDENTGHYCIIGTDGAYLELEEKDLAYLKEGLCASGIIDPSTVLTSVPDLLLSPESGDLEVEPEDEDNEEGENS